MVFKLSTETTCLKIKVNAYGCNVVKFTTVILKYATLALEVLHRVAEQ